ncbi:ABC transporter ATP-binding protein [Rubinisphaera margarita]|uniref:ABC transporter ATP-binding protein n=1 Tax=Rubinisphaera margarita TaxID=2909586 RepID=UPI001EE8BEBD|nr:ABC transporter ATP-binding protein [Rubinisphaera margarita]MCG6155135.1 ABC transporter ATP-binding protein [Rubinisphaera margarita]
MSEPIFCLNDVTKSFRNVHALDHVSFAGHSGEVVALLGDNGAGKTTAINILLGSLKPDSGQARVLGMDSSRQSLEIRQQVGFVPDRPAFYDWMTVDELGWFASGFYASGYHEQYRAQITKFDVPLKKKIRTLSKGMQAKVSLSLSLAHEPHLLILDEPTSGLDPLIRREFLESMVDVAARGHGVLLASHQVSEVERVADVVVILIKGKLILKARLDELKSSACEIILGSGATQVDPHGIPGRLIHRETSGHQQQWLMLDADAEQLKLRLDEYEGLTYELRHPSLEEILLQMLKSSRVDQKAASDSSRETPQPTTP